MRTEQIRTMIANGVRDEQQTGRLAETLRNFAKTNGANLTEKEIEGVAESIRDYIEHVPFYLEQAMTAAGQAGLAVEMGELINQLESYWFEPNDMLPDRLGLLGLVDDAYASLFLLQSISDHCQTAFGRPLLEINLTGINQIIHNLIGEPLASQLDQRVAVTIQQVMAQRFLTQFSKHQPFSFGGTPDPIWGNASIDEIVRVRLGAMGIF